jgi:hypothetical protein
MPGRDATQVRLGPGSLYAAPVGSTEPATLAATLDAAWVDLGYTEDGHTVKMTTNVEPVPVAEELDPISYEPTGREMSVSFALAQITATNLSRALNGGTITAGTGIVTFEPPASDEVTRLALLWESADGNERWIFRKCIQTGDVEIARKKAPAKATIPVEFMLEVVAGGSAPFVAIFDDSLEE